jgi:hypothetical protein
VNSVDLRFEYIADRGFHGDLSVRLGTWHHVCDSYYFAIDETSNTAEQVPQALARLLEQWADQVRLLQPTGGTAFLPFDFSDQCTGWFRANSTDGLDALVEAGWSGIEGWSFYPSDIADAARNVYDFKAINGASMQCSIDELLGRIAASGEALALDGSVEWPRP